MHKAHLIGIAGVGMSATALLLKEAGWRVTGSDDVEVYGPPKDILTSAGITFTRGYSATNIPADVDCFVVGRNAKLDPEHNEEVRAARVSGKPVYTFPHMLGEIAKGRENVVVTGSYGKSTMTALIAYILRCAGVDAGYFIGAVPVKSEWLPAPAKIGTAPLFVLEGDEYPSGHDDPRAKFLHLSPRDVILTSVVHDHVNVYPTFDAYRKPFQDLLALVPSDGIVVVCADESNAHSLVRASGHAHIGYGLHAGHYTARDVTYGSATRFTLYEKDAPLGEIETALLGAHNVENVAGAAAYVLAKKLVTFEQLAAVIKEFAGVRRRLDNLAPGSRVPIFEGFGSSYEKARAAIKAVGLHFPAKRLVVVFEPHAFGWRNRTNLSWYDDVFDGAAEVFVAAPETQGATTHDQLSHDEILARVGTAGHPYNDPDDVTSSLTGDEVVLILTSGDLRGSLEALASSVAAKFS